VMKVSRWIGEGFGRIFVWEGGVGFRGRLRFGVEWVHSGGCGDGQSYRHALILLH
jgi:hypothetical protein